MMCRGKLVFPADAGPKISIMRPRGIPPHSNAPKSKLGKFVGITGIGTRFFLPRHSKELVVSNFLSKDFPKAKIVLNLSTSVWGFSTTTLGSFWSSFFLPKLIILLFLSLPRLLRSAHRSAGAGLAVCFGDTDQNAW